MSPLRTKHTLLLTGLTLSLVLAGCGGQKTGNYPGNRSETILQSKAEVYGPDEEDPMKAHLLARSEVDPNDLSTSHIYTTKPTAEEIDSDTNTRMVRLENQVADLRSDFKKIILPGVTGKPADNVAVAPPPVKPMPAPAPVQMASAASSDVTGVRIGEHPDKTRIVLDVTAPAKFTSQIENNILSVTLPQSTWSGAVQESLGASPLVKGYTATAAPGGGVLLLVELRKPARLTLKESLGPNDTYGNRIVFDVAPL